MNNGNYSPLVQINHKDTKNTKFFKIFVISQYFGVTTTDGQDLTNFISTLFYTSIAWPKFLDDIRRLYRESEFPIPI